jgi:DNA-binding transcriptional LysR family regulator
VELRQLEHFVAVAEEGHFTRAAQKLHIVQSGLSASVRSLERHLGVRLFTRTSHKVALTDAGRALLVEARRTLAAAAEARASVAAVQGLVTGSLSVGTSVGIMQFTHVIDLPAVLGRFYADHPGVDIRLRQGGAAGIVEQVRAGDLDLGFVSLPGPPPPGVEFRPLGSEPLLLISSPQHALARSRQVQVSRLAEETFADFPPDWGLRIVVDQWFAAAGAGRRIGFEVNAVSTMLELVTHGLALGFLPAAIVGHAPGLRTLSLRRPEPQLTYSVAVLSAGPVSTAAQALLDEIDAQMSVRHATPATA